MPFKLQISETAPLLATARPAERAGMPGRFSFLVSAAMQIPEQEPDGHGAGADAVRPPASPRRELLEWCAGILIILALVLTGFALPYM